MTKADDFKCKNCGAEWSWTELDYAENARLRNGSIFVGAASILSTRNGGLSGAVTNAYGLDKSSRMQNMVVDFSKCPRCNSVDIVCTGSRTIGADNPFLQTGQSANSASEGLKKPLTAGLLGIFLGGFGVHKFYLGYSKEGIIMLAIWLVGLAALGIPSLVMSAIGVIEGIIYISKGTTDFQQIYVQGHKAWF